VCLLPAPEELVTVTLTMAPVHLFAQDLGLRYRWIDKPLPRVGLPRREQIIGRTDEELFSGEAGAMLTELKRAALEGAEGQQIELELRRGDARALYRIRIEPRRGTDGEVVGVLGAAVDLSEPTRREAELRAAFEQAPIAIGLAEFSPDAATGHLVRLNDALGRLTGRRGSELLGRSLEHLIEPEDLPRVRSALADTARGGERTCECRLIHADGIPREVVISASRIRGGPADEPPRDVIQIIDLSERPATELELSRLAERDPLTDLLNRRRFGETLEEALAYADRYGSRGAVLVLDVDGFKGVNDRLGHYSGDQLLTQIASYLAGRLRRTDVLARLGADEFGILLSGADARRAQAVAHGLVEGLSDHNFVLNGRAMRVTVSIGSAVFPSGEELTAEELMARADAAMFEAKRVGRATARSFELHEPPHPAGRSISWLDRLREALENDALDLVAQPIRGIGANGDERVELLLRLPGPRGEAVRPGVFMDLAERHNLIQEIDQWVLGRAVRLVAERERAGRPLKVHVNLSGETFTDRALPDVLAALGEREKAELGSVAVELSEGAAIGELDRAQEVAVRLRSLGCELVLDDFGSGFFAFPALKELPFDFFKIDGSYVERIATSETDRLIVRALALLAQGVGAATIAEWVESDRALEFLTGLGIDYGQGFHLSPPVPIEELP
jgi:diguanylate cyclase (GGDEF)-like protein/PAS domain S-box-containing protein